MAIFQPELFRELRTGRYMALTDAFNSVVGENNNTIGLVRSTNLPRIRLTGPRTYFVSTTGSDSNDGLSLLTPFLTPAHAMAVIATIDFNAFTITVQLADGTYANADIFIPITVGQNSLAGLVINGNASNPGNVILGSIDFAVIFVPIGAAVTVNNLAITCSLAAAYGFFINGGQLSWNNIIFMACTTAHVLCQAIGQATAPTSYSVTGGAAVHMFCANGGIITIANATVTFVGSPAFGAICQAQEEASIRMIGNTYIGTPSGQRYNISLNALVQTFTGNPATLPGTVPGVITNGGQYA